MGVITFNGIPSSSLGIQVEHPPEYEMPERDYTAIPIQGRNGSLSIDNGFYKNVDRTYSIAIGSVGGNFTTMANSISKWVHSANGYVRLEDSYEPDFYKMAKYVESGSIANILQQAGRITLRFNRKPQRFLKSGDTKINISATPTTISNPTDFISLPKIVVKGSGNGVLNVGKYKATITNIIGSITLDSEIEDAYNGTTNLNMYVTLLNNEFPELVPGDNVISFSGGITSVEVYPKWWTI